MTQGPIWAHLAATSTVTAVSIVLQTLYLIVDLFFVARLGEAAVAAVGAAGAVQFAVLAACRVLSVSVLAAASHALGRRDSQAANRVFNQMLMLSLLCAVLTIVIGFTTTDRYMRGVAAEARTIELGATYLYWFLPGLALQPVFSVMAAALRSAGQVFLITAVQLGTIAINIVLAPVLIEGWFTQVPLGVAGAGLASTVSVAAGVLTLCVYFGKTRGAFSIEAVLCKPQPRTWRPLLAAGLPAGGEHLLTFVYIGTIYWCIQQSGPAAQAGYGIGSRIVQSMFLPVLAIAWAAAPIVGQNFGARRLDRVRETFWKATFVTAVCMALITLLVRFQPHVFIGLFTQDPRVVELAASVMRISSWSFVAQGVTYACSSLFQGLGDTRPAFLTTATGLVTFVPAAIWSSQQSWFLLEHIWWLTVVGVGLQAVTGIVLALRDLNCHSRVRHVAIAVSSPSSSVESATLKSNGQS